MTKIKHYITGITQIGTMVEVTFKEKVSLDIINRYINEAKRQWKEDGMPQDLPLEVINYLKNQRFQNEYKWKYPFFEWKKRGLAINDAVEIDFPLQLCDIKTTDLDVGI